MAGLSLMEVMIAMLIGLIGIVVITQVYIVNENYKRSTTSAGGAQTNGALALYAIERDVRMAGWGIAWSSTLGCSSMRWHYNGAYSPEMGGTLPQILVAPVLIEDGVANPDRITVFYGTNTERVIPATLSKAIALSTDHLEVDNPQGFSDSPGDLLLVTQGATCSLMQLTEADASAGILKHEQSPTALFNPGGGNPMPAYGAGAQVFNLGRPVVNIYSISNAQALQLASLFTATSSTVVQQYTPNPFALVEDLVDLQAEYGKDNGIDNGTVASAAYSANDGSVDRYDTTTPANATEWQQVLSMRVGVLARSEFYERPEAGSPCAATTDANPPTWAAGTRDFPALGDLSDPANPARCYRYRVFDTVVPLRNMIWRQG